MPSSTITLIQNVPTDLADNYGLPAGDRTAGSVFSIDHEIGLNLVRQGYAQFGDYAAPAGGLPADADITVQVIVAVPNDLATQLGLTSAEQLVGAKPSLSQTDALTLVRGGYAEFIDQPGSDSRGHNPHLIATATLDFPSVAAASAAELTVAVPGAAVGAPVVVGAPAALEAGLVATGRVSAADTVTVRLANVTAAAVDPASAQWKVAVVKF